MAPQTLIDNFMTGSPGWDKMDQNWVGVKKLGAGGFGHAGLWVQIDPKTQLITDRLVIKECYMSGGWDEKEYWHDGKIHEVPIEVYNHRAMNYRPSNVVGFYGFQVMEKTKSYRIYMEFASAGSLTGILKAYRRTSDFIPEAYLWRLFEDLARAAITMENPDVKPRDNQVLIHMDLKPDNIFMQPPTPKDTSYYPIAKVGDFGLSLIVCPDESVAKINDDFVMYTPGYIPPEIYLIIHPPNDYMNINHAVDASPNIYLIGIVMLEFMTKSHPEARGASGFRSRMEWLRQIQGNVFKSLPYSKELKSLVRDCLKTRPSHRPNGEQLLSRVLAYKVVDRNFNKEKDSLLKSFDWVDKYRKGIKLPPASPQSSEGKADQKEEEEEEEEEAMPLLNFTQTSRYATSGGSNNLDLDLNTEDFEQISSDDVDIDDEYNLISPEEARKFVYKPELDPDMTDRGAAMREAMEDTIGGMEDLMGGGGVQELREGVRKVRLNSRSGAKGQVKRAGGIGLVKGMGSYFDVKKFFR